MTDEEIRADFERRGEDLEATAAAGENGTADDREAFLVWRELHEGAERL